MLIYDMLSGFSAFIKHYYSESIEIEVCSNKIDLHRFNVSDFNFCFFSINDIDDLLILIKMYTSKRHFFIRTSNDILYQKVSSPDYFKSDIFNYDCSKKSILEKINFHLLQETV